MTKKETDKRMDDSRAGIPRSAVFIVTAVITVVLTILFLYQTGFVKIHKENINTQSNVAVNIPTAVAHAPVKTPDYSQDIKILSNDLKKLKYNYKNLEQKLEQQQEAIEDQKPAEVVSVPAPLLKNSPMELLNQLMISYNKGGNIDSILQYIIPYIETDIIQDHFQNLLDATPEEGPITTSEILFKLNEAIDLPPLMAKNSSAEGGLKQILSDLVIIRKKGEGAGEVKQNLMDVREKVLQHNLLDLIELFSANLLKTDGRLNDISEKLTVYLTQQQLLFAFKTQYIHYHMRQVE